MNQKNISIRIAVVDGDKVRKELNLTGETGARAMRKIKEATQPASKSLAAINVVAEQTNFMLMHLANGVGTLGISLSRLGPLGLAAAASLGLVATAVGSSLKEFKEAENALNQLNAALKATDSASGVTATQMLHLGESLEATTLFRKEDIARAASSLTSFGNVQGKVFKRAIELSADLAVRLGSDVPSAADMLGHALEKPEAGLGRLSRRFSDLSFVQKESIENFIKQGDVMSAQMVIIEHLESKIKGLAQAQATGLTGATNALSDSFSNLRQSMGKVISEMDIVQAGTGMLTRSFVNARKVIDPTLVERKESLENEVSKLQSTEKAKNTTPAQLYMKAFGGANLLDHKLAELAKVNAQIAQQEKQQADENARSLTAAATAALEHRNDHLLQLQKKYLKEASDLQASPQQKILTQHSERYQEIQGLGKNGLSGDLMQQALSGLQDSTTAKLAQVPGVPHSGAQTQEYYEAQKKALDDWHAKLLQTLDGSTDKNQEYVNQIDQIYNVQLKEIYKRSLADSTSWSDGAQRALLSYSDSAMNAAANAEKLFGGAANRVEDILTGAVTKGKLSFDTLKDFALSTLEDITRSFIRESITGPMFKGLGGILGGMGFGLFHEGGIVGQTPVPHRFGLATIPSDLGLSHIPRLHSGLAPDEFPAILQRGETVLPKNAGFKADHGNINITFNVTTPNVESFMESRGQIMATLAGEIDRFRKRNR